ncbi:MAG: 16S rRNA (adenine(1518)-N(6)/adenine(1519)-N(6))-dimethyltransferase RsmA [Pseudomonadota bacterium]
MSHIDDLPPLRDVIAEFVLAAKKALGQNFLLDLNITMKIARSAGALADATVLEIGPGPGGLTRALLASGAKHVVAIERDERCRPALKQIAEAYPGKLTIVFGDALEVDHRQALADAGVELLKDPVKIVANLPYNIATPLFTNWISGESWPPYWETMVLMFQKEVADRIVATHEDKAWGRLGVLSAWRTHSAKAFDLPPKAFSPPPKVTSSVVIVEPRHDPIDVSQKALERVTQAAFGQRRKMLRQSLKSLDLPAILEGTDIAPTARAEELTLEQFAALARVVDDHRS